jgi:phosphoglycolate phosphatase
MINESIAGYESIVWDWNGALLDDVSLCVRVMNQLLSEHGHPEITSELYASVFEFPVQRYYENVGFDLQKHNFSDLSDRFCSDFEESQHEATLFSEAIETLSHLSALKQFVLSNTEQSALDRMLNSFDISHMFEAAYGLTNNHATGKVGIGSDLLDSHRINRERAILIGDTTHDAEVAEALRVDCLLVATGHNSRQRVEELDVPVVGSLKELRHFIK